MSKAFTKEQDVDDDVGEEPQNDGIGPGVKNYMTPQGAKRLQDELRQLLHVERPKVTEVVSVG